MGTGADRNRPAPATRRLPSQRRGRSPDPLKTTLAGARSPAGSTKSNSAQHSIRPRADSRSAFGCAAYPGLLELGNAGLWDVRMK